MSPIALIAVAREAPDAPEALAALRPIAGRPLLAHQAHRAVAAGASGVLLVAERLSAGLAAAADRLRRDGLEVRLALGPGDAGGKAGAAPLLLLADGLLPEPGDLAAILAPGTPALLTVDDVPAAAVLERLDANSRWAGAALLPPGALAVPEGLPEGWDVELVLVRAQAGTAARVRAAGLPLPLADAATARAVGARLLGGSGPLPAALGWLAERRLDPRMLRIAAMAAAWLGALALGFGPLWLGLALLNGAEPLDALGRRLARVRLQPTGRGRGWRRGQGGGRAAALLLYGVRLSGAPGWEPLLLAMFAALALLATRNQALASGLRPERWSARPAWMLWATTPLALFGYGRWAVAGLALWAGTGLFRLQWRALRR